MKALTLLLLSQLKQENNELIHKVYLSHNYILIVSTVSKRDITLNTIVGHLYRSLRKTQTGFGIDLKMFVWNLLMMQDGLCSVWFNNHTDTGV